MQLVLGLATGILFGVLLQRARVLRYDKQLLALQFKDMTIIKFMLSAVIVGAVGLMTLHSFDAITYEIKPLIFGPIVIGGLLFGVGWALLGYCPGTCAGAIGEGRLDAFWGIVGMLIGGALFAEVYPALKNTIYTWGDFGKVRLPDAFLLNQWLIIALLIMGTFALFRWFEKKGL